MKILTVWVFVSITISPSEICNAIEHANPYDDVSLSEDTNQRLNKLHGADRPYIESQLKASKYYKGHILGFVSFQCAINEMKAEMEIPYPVFIGPNDYWRFTDRIDQECLFPDDLHETICSFAGIEHAFQVETKHRAPPKISYFFYCMYAFLARCVNSHYSWILSEKNVKMARSFRAQVLESYGLTDEDVNASAIKLVLTKFASSYARVRHTINGLHYTYQKALRSNVYLPKLLYDLGLLQAWRFSDEDLRNMNVIRKFVDPKALDILPAPYDFKIVNEQGNEVTIAGILPYVSPEVCPYLPLPSKV